MPPIIHNNYSIVIPAYNEADAIRGVLDELHKIKHSGALEIIVVNDCSSDETGQRAQKPGVIVLSNVQNSGYGYSLKRGISRATHEHIVILDADGSYPVAMLPKLITEYERGFDMVVGARQGFHYRGSTLKRIARVCFRAISEFSTGRKIPDINSGCRIFKRDIAKSFFHTLSSGFSFTTTITLAFMLNAHSVHYVPIEYHKRTGKSKVKYVRDTLRAAQLIVESIVIYNPIKLFLLASLAVVAVGLVSLIIGLAGASWIASVVFFTGIAAIAIFSLGLVATLLKFMYSKNHHLVLPL